METVHEIESQWSTIILQDERIKKCQVSPRTRTSYRPLSGTDRMYTRDGGWRNVEGRTIGKPRGLDVEACLGLWRREIKAYGSVRGAGSSLERPRILIQTPSSCSHRRIHSGGNSTETTGVLLLTPGTHQWHYPLTILSGAIFPNKRFNRDSASGISACLALRNVSFFRANSISVASFLA